MYVCICLWILVASFALIKKNEYPLVERLHAPEREGMCGFRKHGKMIRISIGSKFRKPLKTDNETEKYNKLKTVSTS